MAMKAILLSLVASCLGEAVHEKLLEAEQMEVNSMVDGHGAVEVADEKPFWKKGQKYDPEVEQALKSANLSKDERAEVAVVVKTVLGSHVGVGEFTTHFRTYFTGDWDVHWWYDLALDPWPGGEDLGRASQQVQPHQAKLSFASGLTAIGLDL